MSEYGPIYNVELIDTLSLNPAQPDGMLQQMPSRADLDAIHERHDRVIAGYEVLLCHWRTQQAEIARLAAESRQLASRLDAVTRDKITAEREVERLTAERDKLRSSMAKWASRWLEMVLDRCGDDPAWRHELMPTLTRLYDSVKK